MRLHHVSPFRLSVIVQQCMLVVAVLNWVKILGKDIFIKKLLKSYLQLIRLKKKEKLFIQKHYLQFLSI